MAYRRSPMPTPRRKAPLPRTAKTPTATEKAKATNYGRTRSAEVNKGQQGARMRALKSAAKKNPPTVTRKKRTK